jgi:hypothetical protein
VAATKEYRYMGNHASSVIVGDKVIPVGQGDFVELSSDDEDDSHNAGLIDDGLLVDPTTFPEDPKPATPAPKPKTSTEK